MLAWLVISLLSAAQIQAADSGSQHNIRLRDRKQGLYLTPLRSANNPEAHNFSTTLDPLASLEPQAIEAFIQKHPELSGYRMVLIGDSVKGTKAEETKATVEKFLEEAGIHTEVQTIRQPQGLAENLLNLLPRREDYETPLGSEVKVGLGRVLVSESLAFTVLLLPPIAQAYSLEFGHALDSLLKDIALPLNVAIPIVCLDIANMIPFVTFRRFLSNHNIRLNVPERLIRGLVMGLFFSVGFNVVSQWPQLAEYFSHAELKSLPSDFFNAALETAKTVLPASFLAMFTWTTIGTSINVWEQAAENRRFRAVILETLSGFFVAPAYIISTLPLLPELVGTPVLDLNAAHLALMGMGSAGLISWAALERRTLANWTRKTCGQLLNLTGLMFGKAKPDPLPSKQGNG